MSMVDRSCPMPGRRAAGAGQSHALPPGVPARDSWHAEPQKVFDNLYFVGMTGFGLGRHDEARASSSSIRCSTTPSRTKSSKASASLDLDPTNIKYVLVSRPPRSRGRRKALAGTVRRACSLTAADWDLLERDNSAVEAAPRHGDHRRQKLTLGDTTLTMHFTPGHTNGTVSTLIPVLDGGVPHSRRCGAARCSIWADAERFAAYASSALKFPRLAAAAGADVLLSNHTDYDGTKVKLPALRDTRVGAPHPYVVGADSIRRYLTVANGEMARAALAERAVSDLRRARSTSTRQS